FFLRPIEEGEVQTRLARDQGDTGDAGTRAQIEQPSRTRQQITVQKIERLDNEHIHELFGPAQSGAIQRALPLQQKLQITHQAVELVRGEVDAPQLTLPAETCLVGLI